MNELSKKYEPHAIEEKWTQAWEAAKLYHANPDSSKKSFCMVIPPPNVTGFLHMGHALNNTLQDILARYKRMDGYDTLWVFGLDHAGIATQNVVERMLASEKKSRHEIGREKFIERVWQWKEESGGQIRNQLRKLGVSLDFWRERFTMDEGLSNAVREVFVKLYQDGLIYRGEKLINWCPRCHTALSDLEVEHEMKQGSLWHMRYPLENGDGYLVVATTRPETLLGDTAVAVNLKDERYQNKIGQNVKIPFVNRLVPVIADDYVDVSFGSGVVKITPAHDFNDFEVGQRHDLPRVNVLDASGVMNEHGAEFKGQDRFACRKNIVERLTELDLIEKIEPHQLSVGHCYRCKTVVEPYLSLQWFVKMQSLAEPAMQAVRSGKTKIIPEQWENTYFNWMENIKDWCISRQIWWGHQIPAWYCSNQDCSIIVSLAEPQICPQCGSKELRRETDVLDTWFSSGLWPFSTLGWPDQNAELLKRYYPTSTLVTGFDIIFFWVARMMMMGLYFMKDVPFREVYIHALVRDAQGQKMSKSKGNVMDPLILMDKYGTDALRFTLAAFAAQGRDIKLAEDRIEGFRNFCNKIWNATRYIMQTAQPLIENYPEQMPEAARDEDLWILAELHQCIADVRQALDSYRFNDAAMNVYHFFWGSYCDWYIELSKGVLYGEDILAKKQTAHVAVYVLDQALRLLHPFMPFITEEIWQMLGQRENQKFLTQMEYPKTVSNASQKWQLASERVKRLQTLVSMIRQMRTETGLSPAQKISIYLYSTQNIKDDFSLLESRIKELSKVENITYLQQRPTEPVLKGVLGISDYLVFVPLSGLIDINKERGRQEKELSKVQKAIEAVQKLIGSPSFAEKAPPELVATKQQELAGLNQKKTEIADALTLLN